MSIILLIFAPLALQYERGHTWLLPLAIAFYLLSMFANYTELALLTWDWPRPGEYTFSKRLERLRKYPELPRNYPGITPDISGICPVFVRYLTKARTCACQKVADYLNFISPGHVL